MQTTTVKSTANQVPRKNGPAGPKSSSAKKKKPQTKSNGKETATPAGPRPVAPPPVSGPWGNPKPAASTVSAPPPGFAPSPPKTSSGFSDAHQRLLRHRALFAFRSLVGKAVELQLVAADERYAGILDCVDPDDFSIVLKSAKRVKSGSDAKPFEDGCTVIFRRHQVAHMVADGIANYAEGVFAAGVAAAGFQTDTEISGRQGEHLIGRELEAASSWLDPALDTGALEDSASNGRRHGKNQGKPGNWNQFEANEKLFGVVSSYDENIYTTKLDKTKISTEQSREAERLAQEIERQSAAGNFHLQEERGQAARGGKHADDLDEEARYSSVDRRGLPSSTGGNAYVPPALRNAQRDGKSQSKTTKTQPASASPATAAPPAATAVDPTPVVATPDAPAPPKPLSFSEAVTGRSSTTGTTPSGPKSATEDKKKVVSSSPEKAAAPAQVNGKDAKPAAAKSKGSPKKKESGKEKKTESMAEESKISSSSNTATTTKQATEDTPKAAPKKALNPNAKEFKLSAAAAEFTPSFSVPPAVKEHVSSPYRGGSPGPVPYPHPGMGYPPPMQQEEWMYDGGMAGEEGGELGMPPYGYGVPVGPNGVPMMYPPMMPQQNMRMMGGQGGYGGYQQQGYNPRGYYSPPTGGYPAGGMPYAGGPGMPGVPQPPLPREAPTPTSDEFASESTAPVPDAPAPPVPESTAPPVESAPVSSKKQHSAKKK